MCQTILINGFSIIDHCVTSPISNALVRRIIPALVNVVERQSAPITYGDLAIMIHHGKDSCTVSKKYSMRTLLWIKQKLPSWRDMQRNESHFWRKLAARYSRKFLKGDSISHTTMEKLCYLVDSGEANVWFEKYDYLKGRGRQSTLY